MRLIAPGYLSRTAPGPAARGLTFAALDLETTGLDRRRDRVCEVAIVRFRGDGTVLDEYATLINPKRRLGASTEVHGITEEQITHAPTFAAALPDIVRMLSGAVVVAHHLEFEDGFLAAEIDRAEHPRPSLVGLCTLVAGRAQLEGPSYKLQSLYRSATGRWIEDSHTALGDCRALAKLHAWLLAQAPSPLHYCGPAPQPAAPNGSPGRIHPRAVRLSRRADGYLGALAKRFPLTSVQHPVYPASEQAYLAALEEAITDDRIVGEEGWRLEQLARHAGFSQQRLQELHWHAWKQATAEDDLTTPEALTSQRRNRLAQLAHDLGYAELGAHLAVEVSEKPSTTGYLRGWRIGLDGAADDTDELAALVAGHGGSIAKRLTSTVRFVAAVDPSGETRQLSKARELSLPIVDLETARHQLTNTIATAEAEARKREQDAEHWRRRRDEEQAEKEAYFRHHWRRTEQRPVWGWDFTAKPITLPHR